MEPEKLFNRLNYKPDGSAFARLFDYEIKEADEKEAVKALTADNRLGFMQASHPENYVYMTLQRRLSQTTDQNERLLEADAVQRLEKALARIIGRCDCRALPFGLEPKEGERPNLCRKIQLERLL